MKFLLINTNQIVQKLVEITAKKAGAKLTSITESSKMGDLAQYDYIIIDDDCLLLDKRTYLDALKDKRKCLIYNKGTKRIEGFDDYIQKPFLPTSILDIFTEQLKKDAQAGGGNENEEPIGESISLENLDEGLDKIDSLLADDDMLGEHKDADAAPSPQESNAEKSNEPNESDALDALGKELEDLGESEIKAEPEATDEANADEGESTENLDADTALELPEDISDNGEAALDEANEEIADAESAQSNEEIPDLEGDVDLGGELSETDAAIESAESAPSENLGDSANEVSEVAQTESEELELSADEVENADNELDVELDFTALDELGNNEDSQQAQESDEASADENTDKAKNEGEDIPKDLGDIADEEVGEVTQTEGKELEDLGEGEIKTEPEATDKANADETSADEGESTENLDADTALELPEDINDEDIPALDTEGEGESASAQSSEDTLEGELGDIGAELDEAAEEASADVENVESDMPSDDLGDLGDLDSIDEADGGEVQTESEAEENMDDMLDESESTPPVLDKEQVSEVSQALNALDEQSGNEDFNSLKEPDVAHALGEEVEGEELADIGQDELSEADESMAQDSQEQALDVTKQEDEIEQKSNGETSQEFVKNIIANSVQSSITSLHSDNFKSMLDGLEVTINISFKDKSK